MKLIAALLSSAVLSAAASVSAHATTIAPGIDLNLISGTANYAFIQVTPGTFLAHDGLNSVTAVYLSTPLADTFAITEVCATVNVGITSLPCKGYTLTVADANAAGVSVGLGLSAAAMADTTLSTNLATLQVDGSLGAAVETISFALPGCDPAPVPEPGTLGLMATGLAGAAGAVRRRFKR